MKFVSCFQSVPGRVATESEWRRLIGARFDSFYSLCLQLSSFQVHTVRCPRGCGCDHLIIRRHDGDGAVGVCRCGPGRCPDIPLTRPDITTLEICKTRLGHALCKAFGLDSRYAELPVPNTFQFGSWSTDAVPAILTIQVQSPHFRRAVAELAAQLRQPFILFAPTSDFLDAPAKSILENHGAGFFDLKTNVILTDHGTLQPTRAPGELFARFTPQPRTMDTDLSARVFAIVLKLDTDKPLKPSLLRVFRLYCIDELSCDGVARKCETTKTTVVRRLAMLEARIGVHPRELRRLSPHLAKLQDSTKDSRAEHIRPESLLDDEE